MLRFCFFLNLTADFPSKSEKSTQPKKLAVPIFDTGNIQVEILGKAMFSLKMGNWPVFFLSFKACCNFERTLTVQLSF